MNNELHLFRMSMEVRDILGRRFKKLRLSLTDACNFSCSYCVADELNSTKIDRRLDVELIVNRVAEVHKICQLESIRITGGEPLLFTNVEELIEALILTTGIEDIRITTNGFSLVKRLQGLVGAGLKSINISIDALDEDLFEEITNSKKYKDVLNGIEQASLAGLDVKLNCVLLREKNEHQIIPLLNFAIKNKVTIRFLELMTMGFLHQNSTDKYLMQDDVLDIIRKEFDIERIEKQPGATSNYWRLKGVDAKFGIIANHSSPFCSDCDRLRMNDKGGLYGCLSNPEGIEVDWENGNLSHSLQQAMNQKQIAHFSGSELSMKAIGG